ncbi:MAG: hypothetical protein AB9900_05550 [Humidesulfovibrio sp.]
MDSGQFLAGLRQRTANIVQTLRLRRREPWNWCLQTASLALLPFGLLTHHAALLALAALGFVAGCLALPLPPMEHTELRRLLPGVERLIGLECAWLARPLDRRKKRQLALLVLGAPLTAWLLWRQDTAPVGLAVMVAYLLHVRRQNAEDGIDP